MIPRWVDRYVGIPFAEGSSLSGCNCWGLTALVFAERTGVQLNRHEAIASEDLFLVARAMSRGKSGRDWIEVHDHKPLDFALLRSLKVGKSGKPHRIIDHVGILVSPDHLLHIERGINSVVVPLDHFSIRSRLVSFHRHISQA